MTSSRGPGLPSGFVIILNNCSESGTSVSCSLGVETTAQLGGGGNQFGSLSTPTPVTFTAEGYYPLSTAISTTVSASGLQVIPVQNTPTPLAADIVISNGSLLGVVNPGQAAAYHYIIANNLSDANVVSLVGGGFSAVADNVVKTTFDVNGNPSNGNSKVPWSTAAAAIQSAGTLDDAVSVATADGYVVSRSSDPAGNETATITDPTTDTIMMVITQQDE